MGFLGFLKSGAKKLGDTVGRASKFIGHKVAPVVEHTARFVQHAAVPVGLVASAMTGNPNIAVKSKKVRDVAQRVADISFKVGVGARAVGHAHDRIKGKSHHHGD